MAKDSGRAVTCGDPADVLSRRKHAAKRTLAVHLAFVTVLGAFMLTTEGSSAHVNAGLALELAHTQEVLVALAAVAQASLIGWWTRLAMIVHRARRTGRRVEPSPKPLDYTTIRDARVNRGVVQVCMAIIIVLSWLPEIGYLAQASYETGGDGYGQLLSDFTIGTMVIYALVAGPAALTAIFAKLVDRAGAATSRSFAVASRSLALAEAGSGQAADLTSLRRARIIASRWAAICGCLAVAVAVLSGWALLTGHLNGRIVFMAPALLLINAVRCARCAKAAARLRRAEERLAGHS